MNKNYFKDIKETEEFEKFGDVFTKVFADDENHIYVFKREREDKSLKTFSYEVVKGIKTKNPDGSIVYIYPPSDKFGSYGYYIFGTTEKYCKDRIEYRIKCLKGE